MITEEPACQTQAWLLGLLQMSLRNSILGHWSNWILKKTRSLGRLMGNLQTDNQKRFHSLAPTLHLPIHLNTLNRLWTGVIDRKYSPLDVMVVVLWISWWNYLNYLKKVCDAALLSLWALHFLLFMIRQEGKT